MGKSSGVATNIRAITPAVGVAMGITSPPSLAVCVQSRSENKTTGACAVVRPVGSPRCRPQQPAMCFLAKTTVVRARFLKHSKREVDTITLVLEIDVQFQRNRYKG